MYMVERKAGDGDRTECVGVKERILDGDVFTKISTTTTDVPLTTFPGEVTHVLDAVISSREGDVDRPASVPSKNFLT